MEYNLQSSDRFWSSDNPNSLNACLLKAAKEGNVEEVQHLISMNADVNTQDASGWTPVIHAAFHGHLSVVSELLNNPFCCTDVAHSVRSSGATALHLAAARGHSDIVNAILQGGDNLNSLDFHSRTPLHAAILGGHTHIVDLLCKHNADLSIRDSRGKLPIHIAQEKNMTDAIQILEAAKMQGSHSETGSNSLSSVQIPRFDSYFPNSENRTSRTNAAIPKPDFDSPPYPGQQFRPDSLSPDLGPFNFPVPVEFDGSSIPGWVSPPLIRGAASFADHTPMGNSNQGGQSHERVQGQLNALRQENALLRSKLTKLERAVAESAEREKTSMDEWQKRETELLERIEYQEKRLRFDGSDTDESEDQDSKENTYDLNTGGKQLRKRRGNANSFGTYAHISRRKEWRWKKKN